jgi:tripartite-type tricarboxylate transporter receptor subunit TctC
MKLFLPLLLLASFAAQGQTYPSKPVKLVVPFPAGSATDQVARLSARSCSRRSASRSSWRTRRARRARIAAAEVAQAAPDGYTLMVTPTRRRRRT